MLSTIERVMFLRSADVFSAVSGEDLAPIAVTACEVNFRQGEILIREGEPGDCLYVVVDGEVGVTLNGVGQVATRGPGSVLGEMAILSNAPRSATCLALTDVLALRVDQEDFLEMLTERPTLALGIITVLTQRLDEMTRKATTGH